MATFNVTITQNATPAIVVGLSNNTTYGQFKNSLGDYVYKVFQTYLYSTNLQQIQGSYRYLKYDSSGNSNTQTILSALDPYQTISSLYTDISKKDVVLDGRDYIRFNMLPSTTLTLKLYCVRISTQDGLDKLHNNNFRQFEIQEGFVGYFDQYREFL
jgi:hypothetical protein